jgi:hypothetical protein
MRIRSTKQSFVQKRGDQICAGHKYGEEFNRITFAQHISGEGGEDRAGAKLGFIVEINRL